MITITRWRMVAVLVIAGAIAIAVEPMRGLPDGDVLRAQVIARYPREAVQTWRPLWSVSPALKAAVVAWEDPAFYHHAGLSYLDIFEALKEDIRQGRYARGGSTITQQVAKNLFLTKDKTLRRKLQDAILARRLERVLSKDEILEVYLNMAQWGSHLYGAEAAARFYFGVSADRIDWPQAAMLAAILPNPQRFGPCAGDTTEVRQRRNRVLHVLLLDGKLTPAEHDGAAAMPVVVSCLTAGT